jgi:hypothetical protein
VEEQILRTLPFPTLTYHKKGRRWRPALVRSGPASGNPVSTAIPLQAASLPELKQKNAAGLAVELDRRRNLLCKWRD